MSVKAANGADRMRITEVNPHLICALCGGYLIDATTIVECLHSFCKTCIMRYLETSKYCPICEVLIHKTRPWQNIRLDETLQNIVYKLVPGLFQREMKRRREYYDNQPVPSKSNGKTRVSGRIIFSADEEFSLSLEFWPEGPNSNETDCQNNSCDKLHDRRYLLCPGAVNMSHLKRFIRNKYSLSDRYQIDIFHTNQPLRDHFTLIDVAYIYSWRREGILRLFYAFYINAAKKMKIAVVEDVKPEVEEIKQEPEPINICKGVIFEKGISIIETEKKPAVLPKPFIPNGEVAHSNVPTSTTNKVPISTTISEKPNGKETMTTTVQGVNTNVDHVAIFDDDDECEREMQIVTEEIEIDDSESNLEIVVDDEKPEPKVEPVSKPIDVPVSRPPLILTLPNPNSSKTKFDKLTQSVKSPELRLTPSKHQTKPQSPSYERKPTESQPKPRVSHFEAVNNYVKSQLPKSPIKESHSLSSSSLSKSSYKDTSLQIPKATVKDTASQVSTSRPSPRPSPSPIRDLSHKSSTSQADKKTTSLHKTSPTSPKDIPSRLILTTPKDIPSSRPYLLTPKDTSPLQHASPKKDGIPKSPVSKEPSSQRSLPSPVKDLHHKSLTSYNKDMSTRPGLSKNRELVSKPATLHSHALSYSMSSLNKEPFTRPLPSPKKETFSPIHHASPSRTSLSSHYSSKSDKDVTSRITNTTVKDTAEPISKLHKETGSHSHTIKSIIKDTKSSSISSHIKHVPQVPRLVKTPFQKMKLPVSEPYASHPHNMMSKWPPQRDGFFNGHFKPPQDKPLELKREAVPLDYSKPS